MKDRVTSIPLDKLNEVLTTQARKLVDERKIKLTDEDLRPRLFPDLGTVGLILRNDSLRETRFGDVLDLSARLTREVDLDLDLKESFLQAGPGGCTVGFRTPELGDLRRKFR